MQKSRLALFIAGVLVLASAGTAVFFHAKSREDARRIHELENEIRELEGQLALARSEVSEYREKLAAANEIADELERERDAKDRLVHEYAARIETLEAPAEPEPADEPPMVALLEEETPPPEKETPEPEEVPAMSATERTEAEAGPTNLERELDEVRAERRDLEMKYAALVGEKAEGVPLGKVKVTTGLRLKGKVLVVNQRHNFIVVDVGARDGVEKGMVLILHRGRRFVGKCQVEKVYDRMAAADLLLDWMQGEVEVNDGVRKF